MHRKVVDPDDASQAWPAPAYPDKPLRTPGAMNGDRTRTPFGALALLVLLLGDITGTVDIASVVRTGGAVAVGVMQGYGNVLASAIPVPPAALRRTPRLVKPAPRPPAAAAPSGAAPAGIPPLYLRLYREAGAGESWPDRAGRRYAAWAVLAGIGLVESGHGQSHAPGVRSGVNRHGCCAGPMQFNLRNGPPSTWDSWGRGNVYDPADAIPAAARKLCGNGARTDLDGALLAYNNSWSYVAGVKAQARRYQQGG